MKKEFIKSKFQVKKVGEKMTIIASDETLDRHGEVIKAEAWDLKNYNDSPRLMVDHDYGIESIVGRANNMHVDGTQLLFEPEFHDITELARVTKQMVEEGWLDTVSVGFIPHAPEKDGDMGRNELIEVSFVAVPANPKARVIRDLIGEGVSEVEMLAIKNFAGIKEEKAIIINTIEDFQNVPSESDKIECSVGFIKLLVSDNEKLKTLVDENAQQLKKVVASKDKRQAEMLTLALKEVARQVSDALRKVKIR